MQKPRLNIAASAAVALCVMLAGAPPARAEAAACPFAGQHPMLIVQLFFGQSIKGRGPVTAREWQSFVARTVTPNLSSGFTVYDAYGQWLDQATHATGRERTKVIEVAAEDTPAMRARIGAVTDAYIARFHQRSVGIVTNEGCGGF